ncbi:MAG: molybdenum cofactor biosynthesis protein MoaE [Opitutus sp.]
MGFKLSTTPIDAPALTTQLSHAGAGACVTFEGWVRDSNDDRKVNLLEYEAFAVLADREGERIVDEARRQFAVIAVDCVHRVGSLKIGEIAVWVGVASAHRGAAFDACRYVIDEVKARVPIWKKEHYVEGASEWINCATISRGLDGEIGHEEPREKSTT